MGNRVSISCRCGRFSALARGVSARVGNRLICYCDDCQAYANYLGAADDILDHHGGTEVFQLSPAKLEITQGLDNLACVRLTPKGILRWYADCCKSPIGNTAATHRIPFVGLIHSCLQMTSVEREAILGPVMAGVNARFCNR